MISQCVQPMKVRYKKELSKHILLWQSKDLTLPYFNLPCKRCLYCQMKYSNSWALRCALEAKQWKQNCFITLTYNNENLPPNSSLVKRDLQLFIKRLRKKIEPQKIRFFASGEYGSHYGRPHYHIIIFNYLPPDLQLWKKSKKGEKLYLSSQIEKLWGKGFISVGIDLTTKTMKYTAKYLVKFQEMDYSKLPPYLVMSNRPGIGAYSFSTNIYKTDRIYVEGKAYSVPAYFDKLAIREGFDLEPIKLERQRIGQGFELSIIQLQELRNQYSIYIEDKGLNYNHLFNLSYKKFHSLSNKIDPVIFQKINKQNEIILNNHFKHLYAKNAIINIENTNEKEK